MIAIPSFFQVPAVIAQQAYYGNQTMILARMPDGQIYGGGNLAAAGTVALVTGIVNRSIIVLRIHISIDVAGNVRIQEAASNRFGLYFAGAGYQTIDLFPYGLTLSAGVNLNLNNPGAAAFNWHATVYYTFEN